MLGTPLGRKGRKISGLGRSAVVHCLARRKTKIPEPALGSSPGRPRQEGHLELEASLGERSLLEALVGEDFAEVCCGRPGWRNRPLPLTPASARITAAVKPLTLLTLGLGGLYVHPANRAPSQENL